MEAPRAALTVGSEAASIHFCEGVGLVKGLLALKARGVTFVRLDDAQEIEGAGS